MGQDIKKFYETFAGSDVLAFALFPEAKPITLGQLTTISYSIYREKKPVVTLDRINVAGYTRGPRFIAGSLVFDVYNKSFANDIISKIDYLKDYGPIKADELPLFDILIVGGNEYGYTNKMKIYGCEIGDESQVIDVNQIITNNKFTFAARDIDTFGYEDSLANFKQTQNIIFNDDASVSIEQAFETINYLDDFEISKNDLIKDNGDTLYNTVEEAEIEPTENFCNKTIQEYTDMWHEADEAFEDDIISKANADSKKRKAHHCAEMIRAKSKIFGGVDGTGENKYSEIEIIQNNVKIYSNKILTKVAETANKGERYYIFYNAGPISYISTNNNKTSEVLYIQNGSFLIL